MRECPAPCRARFPRARTGRSRSSSSARPGSRPSPTLRPTACWPAAGSAGASASVAVSALNVAVALLPVLLFLALLVFLDSFKLVSLRSVLVALGAGALAALVAARVNIALMDCARASDDRSLALPRAARGGDAQGPVDRRPAAAWPGRLPRRRRDPRLRGRRRLRTRRERRVPAGDGRAARAPLARARLRDRHPPRGRDVDPRDDREARPRPPPVVADARGRARDPGRGRDPLGVQPLLPAAGRGRRGAARRPAAARGRGLRPQRARDARVARLRPRQRPRDRRVDRLRPRPGDPGRRLPALAPGPLPRRGGGRHALPRAPAGRAVDPGEGTAPRARGRPRRARGRRRAGEPDASCATSSRSIGRTGRLALKPLLRESARGAWQVFLLEEAGGGKTA